MLAQAYITLISAGTIQSIIPWSITGFSRGFNISEQRAKFSLFRYYDKTLIRGTKNINKEPLG